MGTLDKSQKPPLNQPISLDVALLKRVLRTIDSFYTAGTPISAAAFMAGMIELLDAKFCSLTLVRNDSRRKALVAFENVSYNMYGDSLARHRQNMTNQKAWDTDPVAHRLLARSIRHPRTAFTFSTRRWLARFGWNNSFTRKMLDAAGWKSNLTVLMPLERRVFVLVSVARSEQRVFTRLQARLLLNLVLQHRSRIVEMRSFSLREKLPTSLRDTFDLVLSGLSEKEIARDTGRPLNTVHDQVKRLHAHFEVNSRAQLMAKFISVDQIKAAEI